MQVSIRPFDIIGTTVNLTVGTSSSTVQLYAAGIGFKTARVYNVGTNIVYISFVTTSVGVASVSTSLPMMPNSVETFYVHQDENYIAAISGATGNTIYITMGEST